MKAKARILKTAGERQLVMYKRTPIRLSAEKQKLCRSKESDRVNSKWWKGKKKPYNQEYSIYQGCNSYLKKRWRVLQTSETKGVQHHETAFTRNRKWTSLSRKEHN